MTAHRDPDRMIRAFLAEGQTELADPVFDAVRATIEHRRQRVVIGPWRLPDIMNRLIAIGLGAAAVVVVLFIGAQVFGTPASGGVGGAPSTTPTPTATPTAVPSASAAARATPSPMTPPPLTATFTSTLHGFSVSYPEGWAARAATEPWTVSTFPLDFGPREDLLYDPILQANLFLTIASQPIGASGPEAWVAKQMASEEGCGKETEPITVDGATGLIGHAGCDIAVVTTGGRGYWIQLYTSSDDPSAVASYDRAWFESVLATVQLRPEDAVDVAPSPSP